jgi:hypothetical protein
MGAYDNAGKWRGNAEADKNNAIRVASLTPGTPQKDTAAVTITSRTWFTGFVYTGQDGVARLVEGFSIPKADIQAIKRKITEEIERDEIDTVVEVIATDANTTTFNHYGSGTLVSLRYDSTTTATTRGALPA